LKGRVLKGAPVACAGRSPKTFDPPLVLLPETGAQVQVTVPAALLIARGVEVVRSDVADHDGARQGRVGVDHRERLVVEPDELEVRQWPITAGIVAVDDHTAGFVVEEGLHDEPLHRQTLGRQFVAAHAGRTRHRLLPDALTACVVLVAGAGHPEGATPRHQPVVVAVEQALAPARGGVGGGIVVRASIECGGHVSRSPDVRMLFSGEKSQ
jgi:hypothetical protein